MNGVTDPAHRQTVTFVQFLRFRCTSSEGLVATAGGMGNWNPEIWMPIRQKYTKQ